MTISIEWTGRHSLPRDACERQSASITIVQAMNFVGIFRSFETFYRTERPALPTVPEWPQFLRGWIKDRESLDSQTSAGTENRPTGGSQMKIFVAGGTGAIGRPLMAE